jgi:hypothetical protein
MKLAREWTVRGGSMRGRFCLTWFLFTVVLGLLQLWVGSLWLLGTDSFSVVPRRIWLNLDEGILLFYATGVSTGSVRDRLQLLRLSGARRLIRGPQVVGLFVPGIVVLVSVITYCGHLSGQFIADRVATFSLFATVLAWTSSIANHQLIESRFRLNNGMR